VERQVLHLLYSLKCFLVPIAKVPTSAFFKPLSRISTVILEKEAYRKLRMAAPWARVDLAGERYLPSPLISHFIMLLVPVVTHHGYPIQQD